MTAESPMFLYATEMVGEYYALLDLSGSSVLTVTGSGDQVINAFYFGAADVTGYDLNRNATHMAHLKLSALVALTYREFLDFFGTTFDNGTLKEELYQRICKNLPGETQKFFDTLYEKNEMDLQNATFFRQRSMITALPQEINAFLKDEESYVRAGLAVKEKTPEFLTHDIAELARLCHGQTFDLINLSNILHYFPGSREEARSNALGIFEELSSLLSAGGQIIFYSYSPTIYEDWTPPVSDEEMGNILSNQRTFSYKKAFFLGTNRSEEDRINILTKK